MVDVARELVGIGELELVGQDGRWDGPRDSAASAGRAAQLRERKPQGLARQNSAKELPPPRYLASCRRSSTGDGTSLTVGATMPLSILLILPAPH